MTGLQGRSWCHDFLDPDRNYQSFWCSWICGSWIRIGDFQSCRGRRIHESIWMSRENKILIIHRILGLIVDFGGSPKHDFLGWTFWHYPGPCNNGLSGFLAVISIASFAYAGTEMTGLNVAEAANPDKDLPKALKRVFWRIAIVRALSPVLVKYRANFK